MKALLLLVAFLLAIPAHAQTVEITKSDAGLYEYVHVFDVPNVTADQLFDRALTWVALRYNSANDVVQLHDRENHKIIVKGLWRQSAMLGMATYLIHHTLQIDAKDGRYRVIYDGFAAENASGKSGLIPFEKSMAGGKGIRRKTGEQIGEFTKDLLRAMHEDAKQEDW